MTEHEHALELMPGYALGNITAEESRLVERHTAVCPACAQTLKHYQATVGELPEAIIIYEPPADLKSRILAMAAASPGGDTVVVRRSSDLADEGFSARGSREEDRREKSFADRLSALFPSLSPGWRATGLALIVLLAFSNVLLWARIYRLESTSMLRTVALQGTEFSPDAQGTLVISMDGEHGTLVVDGLPALDETRQYQLWLTRDGERASGGVFSVSKNGYGAVWVNSPAPLASYQSVGITIEPAGGSSGPTGEKVLGGDL